MAISLRIEDLGPIGIAMRSTQGGVEVAVPSGTATPGMPDAVSVELSLELGSYNGGSGDFVTVNLLELTGDSSDRLEPLEEIPVELTGLDDIGRLPLPPQLLEVSRAQLGPSPASIAATTPSAGKRASSKRAALSRAAKPSRPEAARRSPATAFQELVVERLDELSGRLSQLEAPDKGALASPSAQPGFSQKSRGSGSRSLSAGGLTNPNVLGRSAPSLRGPAACARARALLGGGANPRSTGLHTHAPIPAAPVRLQAAQPDPPIEAATLGSTLLRITSALEQNQDAGGTVQDAFGLNPGIAHSQEECDAIFGDQSSRESFGASRLGGQALITRVVRARKERPEVVVAAHESRVRRDLSVLSGKAWSWRTHADVCLLPRCGSFRSLKRLIAITCSVKMLCFTTSTLFWNRHHKIRPTRWSGDGPSWAFKTQKGGALHLGPPQKQSAVVACHEERVALDAARKSMGASGATGSDATAPNIALIKKEIQSELDRGNAKGGKGKGGKKGAQGEE